MTLIIAFYLKSRWARQSTTSPSTTNQSVITLGIRSWAHITLPLFLYVRISTWWSTHLPWIPHDDACLYPKEISWCFNLGLTNRTKSCRRSSETHTLARYSYVADGYIVVLVSRLDNKGLCFISTHNVTEMREQLSVQRVLFLWIDTKCKFVIFSFQWMTHEWCQD